MARCWIVDGRGIARKVKNASLPAANQIKDCGATRECPQCHYRIDNSDVSQDWPGLPAGVKFDPSDVELLENLAAKCGVGNKKLHELIDEFIPTLEGNEGICYTHPENLPGAKKDGSSVYFFYRIRNAYACGQRKRRRIDKQDSLMSHVRWHKTGKTKCVMENGVQKGCEKIMVLYGSSKGGSKPEKCNWVMHQYHLGANEDEREGDYVVSKIFYKQPKENIKNESSLEIDELDKAAAQVIPRTPKTNTPNPPQMEETPSPAQETDVLKGPLNLQYDSQFDDEMENATSLAEDSDTVLGGLDPLFCNEIIDNFSTFTESRLYNGISTQVGGNTSEAHQGFDDASCGIYDLNNIELDTPPDFQLGGLQFASQDSVFDWLNRL